MEHLQTDKATLPPEVERSMRSFCQAILKNIPKFFEDPENRAGFERWKAEREAKKA